MLVQSSKEGAALSYRHLSNFKSSQTTWSSLVFHRGGTSARSSLIGPPSGVNGAWFAFQSTSERDRVNQCHPAAHSEAAVANDNVLGRLRCDWVIDAVSAILPPRVPTPDPRRPSASRTVGTCSIASSMECAAAAHDSAGFSSLAADSTRARSPRSNTCRTDPAKVTTHKACQSHRRLWSSMPRMCTRR